MKFFLHTINKPLLIGTVLLLMTILCFFSLDGVVAAQSAKGEVCSAIGGCATDDTRQVDSVIAAVINILSLVVGIIAVIMIIFGGFKYITSSGDANKTASARNTIIYAVVGLIIVALAQVLVLFVLKRATVPPPPDNDKKESLVLTDYYASVTRYQLSVQHLN